MIMFESKLVRQFTRHSVNVLLFALTLLITACVGSSYQAPITDRSEDSDRQPVIIVTDSDDRPSRYIGASSPSASQRRVVTGRQPAIHSVVRGETLYSIAFQYDLDFRRLVLINNLNPPYTIFVGQQLSLATRAPVTSTTSGPEGTIVSTGIVVGNNSVARAQAATGPVGRISRQPITTTPMSTAGIPLSPDPHWQWPVKGQILSNFQANQGVGKGIDIAGFDGQSVNAAASGDVVYAGNGIQGSGNLIIIRHNDRFLSAYANNQTILVAEGDQIRSGDQIAKVGTNPEGVPMLHFEIRMDGTPVDPISYLPRL